MSGDSLPAPRSVVETLRQDPDVEFAVAFGSRVTGEPRSGSDLDIAIKLSDDLSATERFRKRCRLSGRLQADGIPFVDVSDVDAVPTRLKREVAAGQLLCGDTTAFRRFAEAVERESAERDGRREDYEYIRRVAEDGLHG